MKIGGNLLEQNQKFCDVLLSMIVAEAFPKLVPQEGPEVLLLLGSDGRARGC